MRIFNSKPAIKLTQEQVIQKLEIFCAYRERCASEIHQKLIALHVNKDEIDFYLDYLKENNFYNETRFVNAFVRGKSAIKKWGKHKIVQQLHTKNIPIEVIQKSLHQIDEEAYNNRLHDIILKKNKLLNEENDFKRRQKLVIFAQQKGYETKLILNAIHHLNL